jgi:hypothetical protein
MAEGEPKQFLPEVADLPLERPYAANLLLKLLDTIKQGPPVLPRPVGYSGDKDCALPNVGRRARHQRTGWRVGRRMRTLGLRRRNPGWFARQGCTGGESPRRGNDGPGTPPSRAGLGAGADSGLMIR